MPINIFLSIFSLPVEMLMACLKHMPVADLIRLMATTKILRILAAEEIGAQVDVALKEWTGDSKEFLQLLKVCSNCTI